MSLQLQGLDNSPLTGKQHGKFKLLFDKMIIKNGRAHLPIEFMYGPLLTRGRQDAANIVNRHNALVKSFMKEAGYLLPEGLYALLGQLAVEYPKKAPGYWAATAIVSATLATHPELIIWALKAAAEQEGKIKKTMDDVRNEATHCALSGVAFADGHKCEIHHIEGQAESPDLADDPGNLIALEASVHTCYHSWVQEQEWSVCRASLKNFAMRYYRKTDGIPSSTNANSESQLQISSL